MTLDVEKACIANATTGRDQHEEVEVTDEMVAAGELAFSECDPRFQDVGCYVVSVFEAMIRASPYRLVRMSE
jgi:hypothetical protein